jgi:hypothetical protein
VPHRFQHVAASNPTVIVAIKRPVGTLNHAAIQPRLDRAAGSRTRSHGCRPQRAEFLAVPSSI